MTSLVERGRSFLRARPWLKRLLLPSAALAMAGARRCRALPRNVLRLGRLEPVLDAVALRILSRPPLETAAKSVLAVGRAPKGREVLMLVVSDLRIDPRVEREARMLANSGYSVHILFPDPTQGASAIQIDWGAGVTFEALHWTAATFVSQVPGYLGHALYNAALNRRPFAIHSHDLNTCYAGLAAAKVTGAHFVADFHEWTSENVFWDATLRSHTPYPTDRKHQLQALERQVMREASAVITVSQSIVDALAKELGAGDARH